MKSLSKVRRSDADWVKEIALAWQDAKATIPFGAFTGQPLTERKVVTLAPNICLKREGKQLSDRKQRELTRTVLATLVCAEDDPTSRILVTGTPALAFAYAYTNALLWLRLITIQDAERLLDTMVAAERAGSLIRMLQLTDGCPPRHPR